jgi:hypothetical protein
MEKKKLKNIEFLIFSMAKFDIFVNFIYWQVTFSEDPKGSKGFFYIYFPCTRYGNLHSSGLRKSTTAKAPSHYLLGRENGRVNMPLLGVCM